MSFMKIFFGLEFGMSTIEINLKKQRYITVECKEPTFNWLNRSWDSVQEQGF